MAAIVAGTGVGILLGGRLPERIRATLLQGVGLVVLLLGVDQAQATRNLVFPLCAVVIGGLVGEAARIEERLEGVGERIRRRVERRRERPSRFVEGFVAASLVYCVGPLAILGSVADGLRGDSELLVVKAALDGVVSIAFASTLGYGVAFSAVPVLLYQGGVTLLAGAVDEALSQRMVAELTGTGGVLLLGIGFRLLDVVRVKVASFLPALVVAPVLVALFAR